MNIWTEMILFEKFNFVFKERSNKKKNQALFLSDASFQGVLAIIEDMVEPERSQGWSSYSCSG